MNAIKHIDFNHGALGILWQNALLQRMFSLLPQAPRFHVGEDKGWNNALDNFHQLMQVNKNEGRGIIVYDQKDKRYTVRWDKEKKVRAEKHEQLILHTHRPTSVGLPSLRDINFSHVWDPTIATQILMEQEVLHKDVPVKFVFTDSANESYEVSAYWRMKKADHSNRPHVVSPFPSYHATSRDSLGDQIGLVAFARWALDKPYELLFSETGLVFQLQGHDRLWLSLSNLYEALNNQQESVTAKFLFGPQAPDKAAVKEHEIPLSYRRFRWPNDTSPYVRITTPDDSYALMPRRLFTETFDWEKSPERFVADNPVMSLLHFIGIEIN